MHYTGFEPVDRNLKEWAERADSMAWSQHIRKMSLLWISVSSKYHQIGNTFNVTIITCNTTNIPVKQTDCLPKSKQYLQRRINFRVLLHIDATACLASPAYVHSPKCQVLSVRVRIQWQIINSQVTYACIMCMLSMHTPDSPSCWNHCPDFCTAAIAQKTWRHHSDLYTTSVTAARQEAGLCSETQMTQPKPFHESTEKSKPSSLLVSLRARETGCSIVFSKSA